MGIGKTTACKALTALFRIFFWRAAQLFTVSSLQRSLASASFRIIPSPEQGASRITRSNAPVKASGSSVASKPVTRSLFSPMRSMFCIKALRRMGYGSLQTITPSGFKHFFSACRLFPPGAAQRSRIFSTCISGKAATGAIAPGSCTYTAPPWCKGRFPMPSYRKK